MDEHLSKRLESFRRDGLRLDCDGLSMGHRQYSPIRLPGARSAERVPPSSMRARLASTKTRAWHVVWSARRLRGQELFITVQIQA
jgi:hypothetical protein